MITGEKKLITLKSKQNITVVEQNCEPIDTQIIHIPYRYEEYMGSDSEEYHRCQGGIKE